MLQAAKGFRMRRSKLYRYASDAVDHGRQYAYRDRRTKKRTFRYLWQIRINAAARAAGITYSRFIEGLKAAKVELDRKVISDLAATDIAAFGELVKIAQNALKDKAANSGPRAPSLPDRPHSRVVGDHLESSRDLAQKDSAKPCSLCFVPIRRFVQIADRPSVELDSQALAHPQSTFDSSAYLPPSFQLGSSADYLSRAAI